MHIDNDGKVGIGETSPSKRSTSTQARSTQLRCLSQATAPPTSGSRTALRAATFVAVGAVGDELRLRAGNVNRLTIDAMAELASTTVAVVHAGRERHGQVHQHSDVGREPSRHVRTQTSRLATTQTNTSCSKSPATNSSSTSTVCTVRTSPAVVTSFRIPTISLGTSSLGSTIFTDQLSTSTTRFR